MIVLQIALMILALVVLYHLMVWAVPILAGVGLGWLALRYGSGWLVGIGVGFLGTVLALGLLYGGMACRSRVIRYTVLAIFAAPPIWAGAIATHSMAVQTGAQGPIWPIFAGIAGALLFGGLAATRLAGMAAGAVPPASTPKPRPPIPAAPAFVEPEPKVIYYQPIHPPRPHLRDGRHDDTRVIDL